MSRLLLDELPPPQRLALSYAPAAARQKTLALFALDARLASIVRRRGEPVLAQMRLAWWRDALAASADKRPAGETVLGLLGGWRDPSTLIPLVDGWETLLGEALDEPAIQGFAAGRGAGCAELARELACEPSAASSAGRLWALGDLAAHLSNATERAAVIAAADGMSRPALLRALRPLTVLAGLAERSLRRGGTPLLEGPGAGLLAVRLGIAGH